MTDNTKARELWNVLAEYQSPDQTWLQIGRSDFERIFVKALASPTEECVRFDDSFMVVTVSQDGREVGINHPTDADWNDVMAAHIGLRDRLNERIAEAERCPHRPSPTEDEALERARTVMKRVSRELRDHADNISPRLKAYPADMMLREAARLDAAISRLHASEPLPVKDAGELDMRIFAALGGLRDDMPPEDVAAVQRFADRIRAARLEEKRHG